MVDDTSLLTVCLLTMKWLGWWIVQDSWDSDLGVSTLAYPEVCCHFWRN